MEGQLFSEQRSERVQHGDEDVMDGAMNVVVEHHAFEWRPEGAGTQGAVLKFVNWRVHREVADELCEALLAGAGVRPAEVAPDDGYVAVPLLAPEVVEREQVVWQVTSDLSVALLPGREVSFAFSVDGPVVLDGSEAWRLVRALASVRVGERMLEEAALRTLGSMAPEQEQLAAFDPQRRVQGTGRQWLFGPGVTEPVEIEWLAEPGGAVVVRISGNELDWGYDPTRSEGAMLELRDRWMCRDRVGALAQGLIEAPGVVPADVERDEDRDWIDVQVLPPDEVRERSLVWLVSPTLTVALGHRGDLHFSSMGAVRVPLSATETWRLVRVLATARLCDRGLDEAAEREVAWIASAVKAHRQQLAGPTP